MQLKTRECAIFFSRFDRHGELGLLLGVRIGVGAGRGSRQGLALLWCANPDGGMLAMGRWFFPNRTASSAPPLVNIIRIFHVKCFELQLNKFSSHTCHHQRALAKQELYSDHQLYIHTISTTTTSCRNTQPSRRQAAAPTLTLNRYRQTPTAPQHCNALEEVKVSPCTVCTSSVTKFGGGEEGRGGGEGEKHSLSPAVTFTAALFRHAQNAFFFPRYFWLLWTSRTTLPDHQRTKRKNK